ncbi:MAG: TIGR01777 family protein [Phycisphaera sp.]|nr:TIGR01777 family protein [Phycisphaera sp.]
MIIAVSGSTGLVGGELCKRLRADGHTVRHLVRRRGDAGGNDIYWNAAAQEVEAEKLEGVDVVVHLAGENIAAGRWSTKQKKRIVDSRVQGTSLLATVLAARKERPAALICASAIGYYGDRGDELLNEDSAPGDNFLASTCVQWEAACEPARRAGVRVVNTRIGIVLSKHGGALAKMITPFRLGLGGRVGPGTQYMSWISLDDVVRAMRFCIDTDTITGPVNLVAPHAVTNAEFTKTLGKALGRATILPAPAFALKLALGQMADELLLASARVEPRKLLDAGFTFNHAALDDAMAAALG